MQQKKKSTSVQKNSTTSKCSFIDKLILKGLSREEIIERVDAKYPDANNNGTISARVSYIKQNNPDYQLDILMLSRHKKAKDSRCVAVPVVDMEDIKRWIQLDGYCVYNERKKDYEYFFDMSKFDE